MSWIAEYDTQGREFPTCVHVTKTTGTMTHGATYVPIEDGKAVRAENAKLRELVRDMYLCSDETCTDCKHHDYSGEGFWCKRGIGWKRARMRELGIEVPS